MKRTRVFNFWNFADDTNQPWIETKDSGIDPLITAMGELPLRLSTKGKKRAWLGMKDCADWHRKEAEFCSRKRKQQHLQVADILDARVLAWRDSGGETIGLGATP